MRITLDIDNDVLAAATLSGPNTEPSALYGFQPLAATGRLVTNEHINTLRDDDTY